MKFKCKNGLIAAAALMSILLSSSCTRRASAGDDRPLLVVSVEPQHYILDNIVGDRFRIVTLMPDGGNPETFEPTVDDRMAVDKSRIFFTTGFFPFENAAALTITSGTRLVNTSRGIDLIYGTHSHEREHSTFLHVDSSRLAPDPHVWTSVRNARRMARNMAAAVIAVDSVNADEYRSRLAAFDARLDSIDRSFSSRLSDVKPRTFMVWHPSLTYFARDYGLEQLSVSSESKEASMNDMRRIIDEARADSVKIFFYQAEYDSRQAKAINSGVGSRLVPVSPQSYQWETELNDIVNELTAR